MLAKAQGARLLALDIDASRLQAAPAHGADAVINVRQNVTIQARRDSAGAGGMTMVLETSGTPVAAAAALEAIAPWGTVCLVGIGSEGTVSVARQLRKQVAVMTFWTMSIQALHACAGFVLERGIDLDALFSDRWRLEDAD